MDGVLQQFIVPRLVLLQFSTKTWGTSCYNRKTKLIWISYGNSFNLIEIWLGVTKICRWWVYHKNVTITIELPQFSMKLIKEPVTFFWAIGTSNFIYEFIEQSEINYTTFAQQISKNKDGEFKFPHACSCELGFMSVLARPKRWGILISSLLPLFPLPCPCFLPAQRKDSTTE